MPETKFVAKKQRFNFVSDKNTTLSLRLSEDSYEQLAAIAKKHKVTIPSVGRQLLLVGLEEYKKETT